MLISKLCFFFILQMADNIGRRKENIVDLNKYLDKRIRVKFNGGRECSGVLKGRIIYKSKLKQQIIELNFFFI